MLDVAIGSAVPVDLGCGLTLRRRRVAGEMRLEIEDADRATIAALKAIGCSTEIIAFQLRLIIPAGDGDAGRTETLEILNRIVAGGGSKSKAA